ncbi:MAG: glycosyltransferase [Acidimicrobiales bacterium]
MKILVASMPGDGHINPLTGIAVALRDRGHLVRWYAGPRYARRIEQLGFEVCPYQRATELLAEDLNEAFPERARLRGPKRLSFDLERFFVSNVEAHYLDVADLHHRHAFDVLLCDGAFYAERLVNDSLGLATVAVALSTVLPDPNGPPPFFGLRPARTPLHRAVHAVVRRMVASTNKAGVTAYNEVLARHGVDAIAPGGFPDAPMLGLPRILLTASPAMEFPGYRPPRNAEWVGPLLPARRDTELESAPLPDAVTDPATTVVAVSQGTVDNTDPSKLLAPTLEALSGGPYVAVATTGGSETAALRRRHRAPTVHVEDYLDYEILFPHVDAFVTNGGYGSILQALRHGVPIVSAGTREGKNDNNVRLAARGLGINLRTERPKPRRIARAIDTVLGDPRFRHNVDRVRAELATYDTVALVERALLNAAGKAAQP